MSAFYKSAGNWGGGVAVGVGETGVTGMEFSDWVGQLDALTLLPV